MASFKIIRGFGIGGGKKTQPHEIRDDIPESMVATLLAQGKIEKHSGSTIENRDPKPAKRGRPSKKDAAE